MYNEADRFTINLVPIILNFNLELHILEGAGLNRLGKTGYTITRLPSKDRNNPTIKLLYKFNSYSILYSGELIKLQEKNIKVDNHNLLDNLQRWFCEVCKIDTETVINDGIKVCKDCLSKNTEYLKVLMCSQIQRANNVQLNNFGSQNCQKCGKNTEYIGFSHTQNLCICRVCLERNINKTLNTRVKSFISENFINKECKSFP